MAVIASLITAGAGMSILPLCVVQAQVAAGTLVRLDVHPNPARQRIVAAWMPGAESRGVLDMLPFIRRMAGVTGFLA